jgi:hypothetical protein
MVPGLGRSPPALAVTRPRRSKYSEPRRTAARQGREAASVSR